LAALLRSRAGLADGVQGNRFGLTGGRGDYRCDSWKASTNRSAPCWIHLSTAAFSIISRRCAILARAGGFCILCRKFCCWCFAQPCRAWRILSKFGSGESNGLSFFDVSSLTSAACRRTTRSTTSSTRSTQTSSRRFSPTGSARCAKPTRTSSPSTARPRGERMRAPRAVSRCTWFPLGRRASASCWVRKPWIGSRTKSSPFPCCSKDWSWPARSSPSTLWEPRSKSRKKSSGAAATTRHRRRRDRAQRSWRRRARPGLRRPPRRLGLPQAR
jgi:hypothetical protein